MSQKMKLGRIFPFLFLIGGVVLFLISSYIQKEVDEGRIQISEAREQVETSKKVFGLFSVTKPIGEEIGKRADKKISAGKKDIAHYQKLADQLRIGAIVLVVIGVILFFFTGKKKKGSRS